MESDRPFKNIDEQIDILKSKGMQIQNIEYAESILQRISYYTLINGYKTFFLKKDHSGHIIRPHHYIEGTALKDIVYLYDFDKKLRSILYEGLLSYETTLGTELAYRFSEKYPREYSYLNIYNFNHDPNRISQVLKTTNLLASRITQENKRSGKNAIKHYINSHTGIPLWVLMEFLTFGDLNFFYLNSKKELKQKIAQDFTIKYRKTNNLHQSLAIMPEIIEHINHVVNLFRNAVAHNEITYSKVINRGPNMRSIVNVLEQPHLPIHDQAGVFELILCLRLVLNQSEYVSISNSLKILLSRSKERLGSDNFLSLLNIMHFPRNYEYFI